MMANWQKQHQQYAEQALQGNGKIYKDEEPELLSWSGWSVSWQWRTLF